MRRWLAIAAMLAAGSVPAWSQRHGGGAGGGVRVGGGVRPGAGFGFGYGFHRPYLYSNRFGRGRVYPGYRWGYPYVSGYYIYPGYYGDYSYPAAQSGFQGYDTSASYVDSSAQMQQDEIDRLESEVDRLRDERAGRLQASSRPETQPATLLIFQDNHREEVQNYAIVGPTLWIFNELKARKIPLTDLDISAITNANEDRGVDFRLPEK